MSKPNWIITLYALGVFGLVLTSFGACQQEEIPALVDDPSESVSAPRQYGVPFADVPAIADINLYEVNPQVFSGQQNIAGITARLDSLKALGINVIWLMPIYQTGSERSVGSPYAIKNYYRVHPDYGSLADLRTLVDKAHALGMAVILDWVANHTAWDHEWMQTKSWYVQDDNGQVIHPPGTNWLDVAELNYGNAAMRRAMIQAMKYWVLEANVDGYRCDFAAGVPFDFWRAAIDTLRSIPNRELILFAEADQKALFGAGFDLIFGWPFYGSLRAVFRGQAASELYPVHLSTYDGLQQGQHIVRWVTNHDEHAWDATPQQIFGGEAATRAAFVLAATMGGVPLVYNGQEVAVPQQLPFFTGSHPGINWALNPATAAEYRHLLQLRSQRPALRRGQLADYSSTDVALYLRTLGQEQVLVMVNVRNYAIDSYRLPDAIAHSTWTHTRDNSEQLLGESISLAPYEYLIFSR